MNNGTRLVILILVVSIAVFLMLPLFSQTSDIKNYPSKGTGVIAFGDSLVVGVGSAQKGGFVSKLSNYIGEPIKNYGRSGDTTTDALMRVNGVLKDDPNPKVVLVLLGGNDYLQKIPEEKTFQNLGLIITTFQNQGAVVVLLGVRGGVLRDGREEKFKKLAEDYQTAYVPDVLDGLFGNGEFMSDAIHPNDKGYEKISKKVYPVVTEVIQ